MHACQALHMKLLEEFVVAGLEVRRLGRRKCLQEVLVLLGLVAVDAVGLGNLGGSGDLRSTLVPPLSTYCTKL